MTEPQVWTLIAVFATATFGMLTIVSTLFVRVLRAEIGGLRGEIGGEIGGLRGEIGGEIGGLRGEIGAEIGGLRGEIGGLRGEIGSLRSEMNARIDNLDRDVQALVKHTFGIDRG